MSADVSPDEEAPLTEGEDFYMDGEYLVFTAAYHRKRGYCCGSSCRNCPYGDEESTAAEPVGER